MKIAVVDVAAESGGGLSVLLEFMEFIRTNEKMKNHEWYIYTSVVDIEGNGNINVIKQPTIKKSWGHRLWWEKITFPKVVRNDGFEFIISLQNTATKIKTLRQTVYFHNVLLLQDKKRFSLFKKEEFKYAVYIKIIGPITLNSLKYSDEVIVQTETAKKMLLSKKKNLNVRVVNPNVEIKNSIDNKNNLMFNKFFYPASPVLFKDHYIIVKAVENLIKSGVTDFKVVFTFTGNENEYSKNIIRKCSGIPQIEFCGYKSRHEILEMYKTHALLVTSSIESYPFPFIEAMYFNCPIVTLPYEYAQEIVSAYPNTHMCKDFSSSELSSKMKDVMNVIRKQYEYKASNNSWENVVNRF